MLHPISVDAAHLTLAGLASVETLDDLDHNRPIAVALHGWLDNSASFIPLAAHLGDLQLIALDMAGHGHSSHRSADAHYHLVDFVQDLHEALQVISDQPVTLMCHSLGGIVATLYAASFPERVDKLIIIESFGPLSKGSSSSAEQLRESIESRVRINQKEARHPRGVDEAVKARMAAGKMHESSARLLVERNLDQNGELSWRTDRRLRTISSLRVTEEQAECFMRSIRCPVLAITGEQGFQKLKANLERRAPWVDNLFTAECPGHHHLHMDEPEPVAEQIVAFLQTSGIA